MSNADLGRTETALARLLNRRLRTVLLPVDLTPVQVAVIYAFIGFAALYFSDVYLPQTIRDPVVLQQVQALKGGVEVVLTAGLIFALTYRSRRSLERQNQHLNALEAERSILYRVFRHNLRHDTNIVMGYSELIRARTDDRRTRDECGEIIDASARIERYQTKIHRIEQLLESTGSLRVFDLSTVVAEDSLLAELADADDVSVGVDVPEETLVVASPHIGRGFHEVLENAVEHNDAERPAIEVSVEDRAGGMVGLVVADNGPGLPAYERRAIDRMEEQQLAHSSGLGLWLAKLSCRVSGGDLDLPEPTDEGGRVVLELPRAHHRTLYRQLSRWLG